MSDLGTAELQQAQAAPPRQRPTGVASAGRPSWLRRTFRRPNVIRLTSIVIFLTAWEIYGRHTSPIFLSYPTAIVKAFGEEIADGDLTDALRQSLTGFIIGFAIAVAAGIIVGLAIGRFRVVYYALDPFITALYNTTSVALILLPSAATKPTALRLPLRQPARKSFSVPSGPSLEQAARPPQTSVNEAATAVTRRRIRSLRSSMRSPPVGMPDAMLRNGNKDALVPPTRTT